MSIHKHDQPKAAPSALWKRARLQALLFTAGSIGTALVTLGLFSDLKLPKVQGE